MPALLAAGALAAAPVAVAAPAVTFTTTVVPIAGFQGSGYRLGAGAAVRVRYAIAGSEYDGFPAPLTGVKLEFPPGWRVQPGAFRVCPPARLKGPKLGARACPAGSLAGPAGSISVALSAGGRVVAERASVQPIHAPGGAIELYVAGQRPTAFWELWAGGLASAVGEGLGEAGGELTNEGPQLTLQAPLLRAPGGRPATVLGLDATLGSARRIVRRSSRGAESPLSFYYLEVTKRCPHGGMPFESELTFAAVDGQPAQTVASTYREPCPRHQPLG